MKSGQSRESAGCAKLPAIEAMRSVVTKAPACADVKPSAVSAEGSHRLRVELMAAWSPVMATSVKRSRAEVIRPDVSGAAVSFGTNPFLSERSRRSAGRAAGAQTRSDAEKSAVAAKSYVDSATPAVPLKPIKAA